MQGSPVPSARVQDSHMSDTSVFRMGSRKEVQKCLPQKTRDPKLLCLPGKEASPSTAIMPYIRERPAVELPARHARPNQD